MATVNLRKTVEFYRQQLGSIINTEAEKFQLDGRLPGIEPITSEIFKKVTKQGYTFKENEFYWVPTIVNIRRQ